MDDFGFLEMMMGWLWTQWSEGCWCAVGQRDRENIPSLCDTGKICTEPQISGLLHMFCGDALTRGYAAGVFSRAFSDFPIESSHCHSHGIVSSS